MTDKDDRDVGKIMPGSDLDLQMLLTDPVHGDPGINPEFKERLSKLNKKVLPKGFKFKAEDGQEYVLTRDRVIYEKQDLWALHSYYTRDVRLGNLNDREMVYCTHYFGVAGDCLKEGLVESFLVALSRAVDVLELSQSRGGFLRRRHGTFTKEEFSTHSEPPKRSSIMFWKKDQNGGR